MDNTNFDNTNFNKVQQFNEIFNVERYSTQQPNIFTEHSDLVKLRLSLITEEYNELKTAIDTHNYTEVRDAIADLLYVSYGLADCFGFNADKDFNLVHESNMSKTCKTEQEAIDTVEHYKKLFEIGKSEYDSPYYTYNDKYNIYIVKNGGNGAKAGKVLKSIYYKPVELNK